MSLPIGEFTARAGRLACLCAPSVLIDDRAVSRHVNRLAAGFALAVLSQVLMVGTLPLAGAFLAPRPWMAPLPYAAMLIGATVATFPASFLMDAFGRRAAFALGASLGIAGGIMSAWALLNQQFIPLMLGAFWLGISNGFGLFYRHAAASVTGPADRRAAIAAVFGAGAFVGLIAPSLAGFAEGLAAPRLFVGTALAAAVAQVGAFALALTLPSVSPQMAEAQAAEMPAARTQDWRTVIGATFAGVVAWMVMTMLMAAAPLAMAGCGLSPGLIFAGISWHMVAMYAPALFTAHLPQGVTPPLVALGGLLLLALGVPVFAAAETAAAFTLALALLGAGWSVCVAGTTQWLHENGPPSRLVLALHDGTVLLAAVLGALLAGQIPLPA
ncbi:MFS family permease [Pseudochelatococcus lubricantis]|uniref:MFS family permease n=1 Tax=Pseudochelatococcus lubricantis TaxID=1538102 RepID=A0ABX0V1K6_9HYPH|nr:sugar porter family MFS transporter [Pseudochelatococcus lubricantis]NIJ57715.1 MFS family permease [Pseudochelatococcus lubricantis]